MRAINCYFDVERSSYDDDDDDDLVRDDDDEAFCGAPATWARESLAFSSQREGLAGKELERELTFILFKLVMPLWVWCFGLVITLTASLTSLASLPRSTTMLLRRFGVIPRSSLPFRAVSSQADLIARLRDKSCKQNNIPESIVEKVGRNLHLQQHHPLNIIKRR